MKRKLPLILIILVFLTRAVAVIATGEPKIEKDALHYHDLATNLAAGNGFAFSSEMQFPWLQTGEPRPTARRPPLFPVILGGLYALGLGPSAMLWLNVLLATATAWILLRMTRVMELGEAAGLWALVLYLAYPPFTIYATKLLTEMMFMALFTGTALLIMEGLRRRRLRWFALAGLILGLATLARPTTFLLPLVLVLFLVWPRARMRRGWAVLALAFLATMSPWVVRNAMTFHRFEMTFTSRGYNLFMGTYPPTRARSNLPPEQQPPDLIASLVGNDEFEVNRLYTQAAVDNVREDPAGVAKLVAAKAVLVWFQTRAETMFLPTPRSFLLNGPLLALAAVGFVLLFRRGSPLAWIPLLCVAHMVALHLASVATIRYNLPSVPFLLPAASVALAAGTARLRGGRRSGGEDGVDDGD